VLAVLGGNASGQTGATKKIKIGVTMPTADHGWMGGANWWAKKSMDDGRRRIRTSSSSSRRPAT